jgi:seryl-tRNA synthetase
MLDIDFIRKNPEVVKRAVLNKGIDLDIDELLNVDASRREILTKVEELRQQRNEAAKNRDVERGREIKRELDTWEIELQEAEERFDHLMLYTPNIPSDDSPVGKDSSSNEVVSQWGEVPKFDFEIKDHVELGKNLGIIDLEKGTKTSGFRGYYLKNEGATLHLALLNYAFDKIVSKGFSPMIPPTLVHEKVLVGSGHFPFGRENVYQIANPGKLESGEDVKNPLFLTGTSEPSLLAYYMDATVDEAELPIKLCAMTKCYRSEVGDYGRDTRGLYRVHEFDKVEQVIICKDDLAESEEYFKMMQSVMEEILKELGIPYQVVKTSTGDMGAGKYRMNDLEIWMSGRGKYGEICSNSNLTDWQSRRLNMKYKKKVDGKNYYCYTLNATVMPSPRIMIALLENNQQKDGTILIPEVLLPYTNFSEIRPK